MFSFKKHPGVRRLSQKKAQISDWIWYIWNYYRVTLILLFVAIILLGTAAGAIYRSRQENTLYVCFVNETQISDSQIRSLKDRFQEYANIDSPMENVTFDYSLDLTDSAYRSASLMKLSALMDMDQVHLIIAPAEALSLLSGQNLFADARTFLPEDLSASLSPLYCYDQGADGTDIPVGISLEQSPLMQELNLKEDSVLLFVGHGENPEAVNQFIAYCIG